MTKAEVADLLGDAEFLRGGIVKVPCPLCGKRTVITDYDSSFTVLGGDECQCSSVAVRLAIDAKLPKANGHANGAARRVLYVTDFKKIGVQDRLVRGVLGEGILAMVFGESGGGKSFNVFDMSMHIGLGWPWLGHKVTPGGVLYVAAEGGQVAWSNRIKAFRDHHKLDDDQCERLPLGFVLGHINLGHDGGDVETIIAAAKELKARKGEACKLIIIDTLARATPGSNENDPVDTNEFIAKCDRIREATGATVLIVHTRARTRRSERVVTRPCAPRSTVSLKLSGPTAIGCCASGKAATARTASRSALRLPRSKSAATRTASPSPRASW